MPLTAAMSSGTRRSGAGTRRPPPRPPPPSPTEHPPLHPPPAIVGVGCTTACTIHGRHHNHRKGTFDGGQKAEPSLTQLNEVF